MNPGTRTATGKLAAGSDEMQKLLQRCSTPAGTLRSLLMDGKELERHCRSRGCTEPHCRHRFFPYRRRVELEQGTSPLSLSARSTRRRPSPLDRDSSVGCLASKKQQAGVHETAGEARRPRNSRRSSASTKEPSSPTLSPRDSPFSETAEGGAKESRAVGELAEEKGAALENSRGRKRRARQKETAIYCPTNASIGNMDNHRIVLSPKMNQKKSSLHLTHVTFSPNGEEVLLSYSGEHVYLMDVKCDDDSTMRYTAADVPKYLYLAPGFEELKLTSSPACCSYRMTHRLDLYKNLVQTAANILEENSNLYLGIEACNEVLDGKGPDVGVSLRYECLCIRAALLLKMKWKNDVYMAIRDCRSALRINPSSFKAHFYMAEALMQLGKLKEAFEFAKMAVNLAPSNCEAADMVATIKIHLAAGHLRPKSQNDCKDSLFEDSLYFVVAAEAEKGKKDTEETARSEIRHGRLRSLSDVLFRAELNNTHLESRYEREHSDCEEEMELDFETAISGDEVRETDSNILRGSLNLRFRRDDSTRESFINGSEGLPSPSSQTECLIYQPEITIDMKRRYIGHCNVGTDIKQASFLGGQGEFVASGSDDGRWFIWEKKSGRLVKMLAGDESVVNCIQCHPFDCAIATSGIDYTIKMWTPHALVPSMVAGGAAGPEPDIFSAIEMNQREICRSREVLLPLEFLERIRMHELAEGTLHPFECAQS
ncbi:hypothetical protein ZIOFF_059831 [Zingiber officinale]|uniref:WD and tetratricopeptide repeats protein 1 n=1 Tax=Zingiber officinale TaxID=94328 RepID=A0A8J5F7V7_ZINOF|nr:hypothetical protein ZIOFF_059831 [Zingiber officinale]